MCVRGGNHLLVRSSFLLLFFLSFRVGPLPEPRDRLCLALAFREQSCLSVWVVCGPFPDLRFPPPHQLVCITFVIPLLR